MKAPSKNISASLRGQSPSARGSETPTVGRQKRYGPSMTVPGEGGTEKAPGTQAGGRQGRSADVFADAAGSKVGG